VFAAITGRNKDDVIGEDLRQHRRARRTAVGALVVISALAIGAGLTAWYAVVQRDTAQTNERTATARALEAASQAGLTNRLGQSLLFGATADTVDGGVRSKTSLFQALSADPHLVKFVHQPTRVQATAWVGDTNVIAHGGDGFLAVTNLDTGENVELPFDHTPSVLTATADGDGLIAGTTTGQLLAYRTSGGPAGWEASVSPSRAPIVAVATSPDGSLVAGVSDKGELTVRRRADGAEYAKAINVLDLGKDGSPGGNLKYLHFLGGNAQIAVGTDLGELLVLDTTTRGVARDWTGSVSAGTTYPQSAYGAVGDTIKFVYGDLGNFVVTRLAGVEPVDEFPQESFLEPSAIALSSDGKKIGLDNNGVLQVVQAKGDLNTNGSRLDLPGTDSVGARLEFSPNGRSLASTDGSSIAIWNLEGSDGIASTLPVMIPSISHVDNHTPVVASDADAEHLIWPQSGVGTTGTALVCWNTTSNYEIQRTRDSPIALTMSTDRRTIFAVDDTRSRVARADIKNGCPGAWTYYPYRSQSSIDHLAALADGSVVVSDSEGTITRLDSDGTPIQAWPSPDGPNLIPLRVLSGSPDGTEFVAGMRSGTVTKFVLTGTEVTSHWTIPNLGVPPVVDITYCTPALLAISDGAGSVTMVDSSSGAILKRFEAAVGQLSCTADGRILVGVAPNKEAFVWDLTGDTLLGSFTFSPVTLSPDSPFNIGRVSSEVGTEMVPDDHQGIWFLLPGTAPTKWDFNEDSWPQIACDQVGRAMTQQEWADTVGTAVPENATCSTSGLR
jgi:hypothetical protein